MRLEHFLAVPIACCLTRTYAIYELVNRIHNRAVPRPSRLNSAG
jgi:hypothetical protein